MNDHPWFAPTASAEVKPIPWLHPDAVEYFDTILQPGWDVLEHGSGGSTLWLAERVRSVVSVEHTEEWRAKIRELAPANVTMLSDMPAGIFKYDLMFIDGERAKRGLCLDLAPSLVVPGGWVVLDNANRPEYRDEREAFSRKARLVRRFENNIPTSKYFVTEFWRCVSESTP